jgi:hypothetical protein
MKVLKMEIKELFHMNMISMYHFNWENTQGFCCNGEKGQLFPWPRFTMYGKKTSIFAYLIMEMDVYFKIQV